MIISFPMLFDINNDTILPNATRNTRYEYLTKKLPTNFERYNTYFNYIKYEIFSNMR